MNLHIHGLVLLGLLLGDGDRENTVLGCGLDVARVGVVRQTEAALKLAIRPLNPDKDTRTKEFGVKVKRSRQLKEDEAQITDLRKCRSLENMVFLMKATESNNVRQALHALHQLATKRLKAEVDMTDDSTNSAGQLGIAAQARR